MSKQTRDTYIDHVADDLLTGHLHVVPLDVVGPAQHTVPAEELVICPPGHGKHAGSSKHLQQYQI